LDVINIPNKKRKGLPEIIKDLTKDNVNYLREIEKFKSDS